MPVAVGEVPQEKKATVLVDALSSGSGFPAKPSGIEPETSLATEHLKHLADMQGLSSHD
jgi:hypothetical protein